MTRRIFIATPAGGGRIHARHAECVDDFREAAEARGWTVFKPWRMGSLGLDRARNLATAHFLWKTGCTDFVFLDSGTEFMATELATMVESPFDVCGAAYPGKNIDWDRVRAYARAGMPAGALPWIASDTMMSATPEQLEQPIRVEGLGTFFEVDAVGTAILVIRREVFERFLAHYHPEIAYHADLKFDGFGNLALWWQGQRDPACDTPEGGYLGEDYAFCRRWKMMGGKIHVYADAHVVQAGEMRFHYHLAARLAVTPKEPAPAPAALPGPALPGRRMVWLPGDPDPRDD